MLRSLDKHSRICTGNVVRAEKTSVVPSKSRPARYGLGPTVAPTSLDSLREQPSDTGLDQKRRAIAYGLFDSRCGRNHLIGLPRRFQ